MGYAFIWGKTVEKVSNSRGSIADDQSNKSYVHNIFDPKVLSASVLGM